MTRRLATTAALGLCLLAGLGFAGSAGAQNAKTTGPTAPRRGAINGVVLNQRGLPVAGAKASYMQLGVIYARAIVYSITDRRGRFRFGNLDWGRYNVYAEKESAGYPDQSFAFYGDNVRLPLVVLNAAHPSAHVVLHVARAAVLTGTVTDASTGRPVSGLRVLMKQPVSGAWFSGTAEASLRVLIPPLVQVNLTLTAPGYRPWQRILRMAPGQVERVAIRMTRSR